MGRQRLDPLSRDHLHRKSRRQCTGTIHRHAGRCQCAQRLHKHRGVGALTQGGIIDDTVINKQDSTGYYIVSNAGCSQKDLKHFREQLDLFHNSNKGVDVKFNILDMSLVALQGPLAVSVLEKITGLSFKDFGFMTARRMEISSIPLYITRCGYTGEDGFEISVPHANAEALTNLFLKDENVKLAGLGCRDSLRLEAGLCLYGHDLDDTISPVEAGLTWTIGKLRRESGQVGFLGSEIILPQIKGGVPKRRVGLIVSGAPARGIITSNGFRTCANLE